VLIWRKKVSRLIALLELKDTPVMFIDIPPHLQLTEADRAERSSINDSSFKKLCLACVFIHFQLLKDVLPPQVLPTARAVVSAVLKAVHTERNQATAKVAAHNHAPYTSQPGADSRIILDGCDALASTVRTVGDLRDVSPRLHHRRAGVRHHYLLAWLHWGVHRSLV
jgi:hypothetical protein